MLPCCLPFGKAGGLQILCCQGFVVNDYNFTLDALALKPSSFCNVRVKLNLLIRQAQVPLDQLPVGAVSSREINSRGRKPLPHSKPLVLSE